MGCDCYIDECDCVPARHLVSGIDGPGNLKPGDSRVRARPVRLRSREDSLLSDLERAVARYLGLDEEDLCCAPRWAEAVEAMHTALTCESPTGPNYAVIGRLSAAIAGVMEL